MFGIYRFILSLLVVAEHSGINSSEHFDLISPSYHIGASAVVGFYLLSGYVMAHSFRRNFGLNIKKTLPFYLDRFLRIYPTYIFLFISIMIFIVLAGQYRVDLNFNNIVANITIIPLNLLIFYSKGANFILFPNNAVAYGLPFAMPNAPSLALELQFYLVLPFILYYRKLLYAIYPISIIIFVFAATGFIPWWHGYLLLPGTLYIFLSGAILYEFKNRINMKMSGGYLACSSILLLVILIYILYTNKYEKVGHIREVIIGFELSLVIVYILSKIKSKNYLDILLGGLSYPIFLCANAAKLLPEYFFRNYNELSIIQKNGYQIISILLVALLAYYLIDYNTQKYRKKIQYRLSKPKVE